MEIDMTCQIMCLEVADIQTCCECGMSVSEESWFISMFTSIQVGKHTVQYGIYNGERKSHSTTLTWREKANKYNREERRVKMSNNTQNINKDASIGGGR